MIKTKFFKAFALINFIVLLMIFLLYRSNFFDKYPKTKSENKLISPNGGTPVLSPKDSVVVNSDSISQSRFSSSKSMIIIDNLELNSDSIPSATDSNKFMISDDKKSLMPGSKSGIIIDSGLLPDSVKIINNK